MKHDVRGRPGPDAEAAGPGADADRLVRRGLKLAHMRLVVAVEETGQISAAARRLSIAQSAASRLMAELERMLGTRLYERHPRGVTINAAGRLLADCARRTLRDIDRLDDELIRVGTGLPGRIRIGAVTGPAMDLVVPALIRSRESDPHTEISIIVDTSEVLAEQLIDERLDFYLGRVPDSLDIRALNVVAIEPERFCLIARAGHPLLAEAGSTLGDALAFDWVVQPPGGIARRALELYFKTRGIRGPERIVSSSSLLLTMALVEGSDALAPLARPIAQFQMGIGPNPPIGILPFLEGFEIGGLALVSLDDRPNSQATRTFRDTILRTSEEGAGI